MFFLFFVVVCLFVVCFVFINKNVSDGDIIIKGINKYVNVLLNKK